MSSALGVAPAVIPIHVLQADRHTNGAGRVPEWRCQGGCRPPWERHKRRLAEGRLHATTQLLLAAALAVAASTAIFPLSSEFDIGQQSCAWAPLLHADRCLALRRSELEETAAVAAPVRVAYAFGLASLASSALLVKWAVYSPFYQITG